MSACLHVCFWTKLAELHTETEIEGTSKVSCCICLIFLADINILNYYLNVGNPLWFLKWFVSNCQESGSQIWQDESPGKCLKNYSLASHPDVLIQKVLHRATEWVFLTSSTWIQIISQVQKYPVTEDFSLPRTVSCSHLHIRNLNDILISIWTVLLHIKGLNRKMSDIIASEGWHILTF